MWVSGYTPAVRFPEKSKVSNPPYCTLCVDEWFGSGTGFSLFPETCPRALAVPVRLRTSLVVPTTCFCSHRIHAVRGWVVFRNTEYTEYKKLTK